MKVLILADIHSNFEALKEIFNYIKKEKIKINRSFILGDIIGYGPFPNECIKYVRNIPLCSVVPGNHEMGVINRKILDYFSENARRAIMWTGKVLSRGNYKFISNLPATITTEYNGFKYLFLHGSPLDKIKEYISNNYIAGQNFKAFKEDVCFFGHTHLPVVYLKHNNKVSSFHLDESMKIEIKHGYRYLINTGAVGQPRDGDPRAGFGILDTKENTLVIKRVDYNFKLIQKYIIDSGLPYSLASRLAHGR